MSDVPFWKRALALAGEVALEHVEASKLNTLALRECPFGHKHWVWDRLCMHGFGVSGPLDEDDEESIVWHGGVLDLDTDVELHPCAKCSPDMLMLSHQWSLSEEEEALLTAWRAYRGAALDAYGEALPYNYKVIVDLDGAKSQIMEHTQGLATLRLATLPTSALQDDPNLPEKKGGEN